MIGAIAAATCGCVCLAVLVTAVCVAMFGPTYTIMWFGVPLLQAAAYEPACQCSYTDGAAVGWFAESLAEATAGTRERCCGMCHENAECVAATFVEPRNVTQNASHPNCLLKGAEAASANSTVMANASTCAVTNSSFFEDSSHELEVAIGTAPVWARNAILFWLLTNMWATAIETHEDEDEDERDMTPRSRARARSADTAADWLRIVGPHAVEVMARFTKEMQLRSAGQRIPESESEEESAGHVAADGDVSQLERGSTLAATSELAQHLESVGLLEDAAQQRARKLVEDGYTSIADFHEMSEDELKECGFRGGDIKKVIKHRREQETPAKVADPEMQPMLSPDEPGSSTGSRAPPASEPEPPEPSTELKDQAQAQVDGMAKQKKAKRKSAKRQATWDEAKGALRLSPNAALAQGAAKFLLWHASQPLSYFMIVRLYYCQLDPLQRVLAVMVAVREVAYLCLASSAAWVCPVYLLINPVHVWRNAKAPLSERLGRLASYALAPEVCVINTLVTMLVPSTSPRGEDSEPCHLGLKFYALFTTHMLMTVGNFASLLALVVLCRGEVQPPRPLLVGYTLTVASMSSQLVVGDFYVTATNVNIPACQRAFTCAFSGAFAFVLYIALPMGWFDDSLVAWLRAAAE